MPKIRGRRSIPPKSIDTIGTGGGVGGGEAHDSKKGAAGRGFSMIPKDPAGFEGKAEGGDGGGGGNNGMKEEKHTAQGKAAMPLGLPPLSPIPAHQESVGKHKDSGKNILPGNQDTFEVHTRRARGAPTRKGGRVVKPMSEARQEWGRKRAAAKARREAKAAEKEARDAKNAEEDANKV